MEFKPLPLTYTVGPKDGSVPQYVFRLARRVEDVAMYEQTGGGLSRPRYEVVIVQKNKARTIKIKNDDGEVVEERQVPASESVPAEDKWGRSGWTLRTLPEAEKKFDALVAARKEAA